MPAGSTSRSLGFLSGGADRPHVSLGRELHRGPRVGEGVSAIAAAAASRTAFAFDSSIRCATLITPVRSGFREFDACSPPLMPTMTYLISICPTSLRIAGSKTRRSASTPHRHSPNRLGCDDRRCERAQHADKERSPYARGLLSSDCQTKARRPCNTDLCGGSWHSRGRLLLAPTDGPATGSPTSRRNSGPDGVPDERGSTPFRGFGHPPSPGSSCSAPGRPAGSWRRRRRAARRRPTGRAGSRPPR